MALNIALACDTNPGGARVYLDSFIDLMEPCTNIYFLSKRALRNLRVISGNRTFDDKWMTDRKVKVCDHIDDLPSDVILYEDNFPEFWASTYTRSRLKNIKRRLTRNHVYWMNENFTSEVSDYVKNYISSFIPDYIRNHLSILKFTNTVETGMYYSYKLNFQSLGSINDNRPIDFVTSYRPDSNKMSEELKTEIKDLMFFTGNRYCNISASNDSGSDDRFVDSHLGYLNWFHKDVQGYLHYQDQWIETFGFSLYEAIKLCDYVVYKPELYCDRMIELLPESDKRKIIRVHDIKNLYHILMRKDFQKLQKSKKIYPDIYTNEEYHRSFLTNLFENLHYD